MPLPLPCRRTQRPRRKFAAHPPSPQRVASAARTPARRLMRARRRVRLQNRASPSQSPPLCRAWSRSAGAGTGTSPRSFTMARRGALRARKAVRRERGAAEAGERLKPTRQTSRALTSDVAPGSGLVLRADVRSEVSRRRVALAPGYTDPATGQVGTHARAPTAAGGTQCVRVKGRSERAPPAGSPPTQNDTPTQTGAGRAAHWEPEAQREAQRPSSSRQPP
jgi:hypothetical protein